MTMDSSRVPKLPWGKLILEKEKCDFNSKWTWEPWRSRTSIKKRYANDGKILCTIIITPYYFFGRGGGPFFFFTLFFYSEVFCNFEVLYAIHSIFPYIFEQQSWTILNKEYRSIKLIVFIPASKHVTVSLGLVNDENHTGPLLAMIN